MTTSAGSARLCIRVNNSIQFARWNHQEQGVIRSIVDVLEARPECRWAAGRLVLVARRCGSFVERHFHLAFDEDVVAVFAWVGHELWH